jgi:hypothetical protein
MESRIKLETGQEENAQTEGPIAQTIESQTAKLPSDVWLWASLGSMALSLGLQLSSQKKTKQISNFIGQWVPTLLIFGLYNKLVKVAGHDRASA